MKKQFLEVGKVLKVHGLDGSVKVQHWCDNSSVFKNFEHVFFDAQGELKTKIRIISLKSDFVILKFSGVNSIEQAVGFIGKILFVNRSSLKLPSGRYFIQDLIGASVVDSSNPDLCYGKVTDVLNFGANDIYKIKSHEGKEILIPAINEIIIKKNLAENLIFIKPMEGLFND